MSDSAGKVDVLWVDDDSPKSSRDLGAYRVTPVQTVGQAEELLEKGKIDPSFIVMDLVVPQGGWGEGYLKIPGIDYIRYLKQRHGKRFKVGVYTAFETEEKKRDSLAAGAVGFYEKTRFGLPGVLEELGALKSD
jgi:DNA-binding NarL/FixJ family response regulator